MPDYGERALCSEKIFVPPSFPSILKGYCKAAIRTQPYDLLRWSAAYFRALANGENPPEKERLEFPPTISPPGLTPGYLKALVNQLGRDPNIEVTSGAVARKWSALCLPPGGLDPLLQLLGGSKFRWLHFLAIAAGSISSSLTQTMILICELLTLDPEGGRAAIPVDIFVELYEFLAYLDCGPNLAAISSPVENPCEDDSTQDSAKDTTSTSQEEHLDAPRSVRKSRKVVDRDLFPGIGPVLPEKQVLSVVEFMKTWAAKQDGVVMPRNIRHWMCPPLDNSFLQV